MRIPDALLGALFVSEDGRLACQIDRGTDAPFVTSVWAGVAGQALLSMAHSQWHPAKSSTAEYAGDRLGHVDAELGIVGVGNLYTLYVVRKNPDPATFGDKQWIAALADTPLTDLRLFPEYGGSPYMPDDWDWQEGWWYPYSTFRPLRSAGAPARQASEPDSPGPPRSR